MKYSIKRKYRKEGEDLARETYKFKRGSEVIVSFPDDILTKAREYMSRNEPWRTMWIRGEENGETFKTYLDAERIVKLHNTKARVVYRRFAKYAIRIDNHGRWDFPGICLAEPSDEFKFWEAVKNERFSKPTFSD